MKRIGITGGIGSGKSTVCDVFKVMGIPVYNADQAAKHLMNSNPDLRDKISKLLGKASYKKGKLDRTYVASLVFKDKSLLEALNKIVHPAVFQDLNRWFEACNSIYAIYESALIFQYGSQDYLDRIIYVYASEQIRLERIMERDDTSAQQVKKRMDNQPNPILAIRESDYLIINENLLITPQIVRIHKDLISG